ncbi:transposable element Tc1 transposase [Trichonephila clavipes]|nr:transposable element Tc1 transposase [Trichonephila clavipes]
MSTGLRSWGRTDCTGKSSAGSRFKKTVLKTSKDQGIQGYLMNVKERWVVRQVHINPRTSALKMTSQCKFRKSVNPETVRNVLRKHKHHRRVPQRKPYISKANRQARLAFAKM